MIIDNEVHKQTQLNLITGKTKDPLEAEAMAFEKIMSERLDKEGNYIPREVGKSETSDIKAAVEAKGETYDPSKYDYMIQNGKVFRKAK